MNLSHELNIFRSVSFHVFVIGQSGFVIGHWFKVLIIIIILLESAVQGREKVRILYQSKDPNPTQLTHVRKKKIKLYETKEKEQIIPTGKHWLCS